MRKEELIREIAMHTGIDRSDIREVVKATFMIIKTCVMNGEEFCIEGVGEFTQKRRKPKDFRNILTGDIETTREVDLPYFRVYSGLKEFVKEKTAKEYEEKRKIKGSGTEG